MYLSGQAKNETHYNVSGVFVLSDMGVLDDQGTLEVPQHARRDITGERSGSIGFGGVVRVLFFSFFWVRVNLRSRRSRRFRRRENVVKMVVVEIRVSCPLVFL